MINSKHKADNKKRLNKMHAHTNSRATLSSRSNRSRSNRVSYVISYIVDRPSQWGKPTPLSFSIIDLEYPLSIGAAKSSSDELTLLRIH